MTGIILKAIYKTRSIFGLNPRVKVEKEVDGLKRKIILEKKKDVRNLRQTNNTIKVLLERGEFEIRIIRSKSSNPKRRKYATSRKKD